MVTHSKMLQSLGVLGHAWPVHSRVSNQWSPSRLEPWVSRGVMESPGLPNEKAAFLRPKSQTKETEFGGKGEGPKDIQTPMVLGVLS